MTAFATRLLRLCPLALFFAATAMAPIAHAQTTPPAGALISNQASATCDFGGVAVNLLSNSVQLTVAPVEGLQLQANQTRRAPIGAPVALPHRLTNTGNVANSYFFRFFNQTGDDTDLSDLRLYGDLNGNGLADDGEPRFDANSPALALRPGQTYDLLLTGTVPLTARGGQNARVQLEARTQSNALSAQNVDTITVASGVAIEVRKSASTQSAARGQVVTYDLTAISRGSASPDPVLIQVDGAPRSLVVLRDTVPANTTLESFAPTGLGTALYHRGGDASNAYFSAPPQNAIIDGVALGLSGVAPGDTVRATLRVRVNGNASGPFDNTADFLYRQADSQVSVVAPSNTVNVAVPLAPPTLSYYTDASYARPMRVTGLNRPLYLQGDSAACNQDAARAERVTLTIVSTLTGDRISTEMLETGLNTGVFRVLNPIPTAEGDAIAGDNILQIRRDDTLQARLGGCGTADALARILVDPQGIVYDARSNLPVAGARVTLINVATGQPARVLDFDGVTARPSSVVTGADGVFQFPQVAPGRYRLQIEPPANYAFPSKLAPANQPAGRNVDAAGSYGGEFAVDAATGAVTLDVPLDPPLGAGLFVDKIARSRDAEIGGTVDYQVTVRNVAGIPVTNVQLLDGLPRGLTFVPGSARRQNGDTNSTAGAATFTALPDPRIENVRALTFDIGTLAAGARAIITYRTQIGPGTATGKIRNSARATGASAFDSYVSNTASADVLIRGGVFTTRGVLMGRVFVDLNGNGGFDRDELAVPGARVFLEDGTYAVTDRDGQWTIYGVLPLTHVVKIDRTTLPQGATLKPLTVNYAGKGDSVFADLKNSELQRINFALSHASDALISEIKTRIAAGEPNAPELRAQLQTALPAVPTNRTGDNRAQPATGIVGGGGASVGSPGSDLGSPGLSLVSPELKPVSPELKPVSPELKPVSPELKPVSPELKPVSPESSLVSPELSLVSPGSSANLGAARTVQSQAPAGIDARPLRTANDGPLDGQFAGPNSPNVGGGALEIEQLLATLQPGAGFINLKEGDTLLSDQINLRVKGTASAALKLALNGEEVSARQIGVRSSDAARDVQVLEFIGLKLRVGANVLRLSETDPFGNVRGDVSIRVIAPGNLGVIRLTVPTVGVGADGQTVTRIGVELVDDKGVRVTARTPLTLETSAGIWKNADLNATQTGTQVFIEGGQASFELVAPFVPGQAAVRVSAGIIETSAQISFVPYLRPVLAAGLFEGQFGFKAKGASQLPIGAFERELQSITGNGGARAAGYVKGRIQGQYLLSMRFDSQSDEDNRLFRDIQPDEFYPVYGDSSIKGFDAQSTGKLYIRVDKDHSYALYGDFTTYSSDGSESLGRYGRALTGAQLHGENEKYSGTAFVSRTNASRVIEERRANGTSGVYQLGMRDLRPQSEIVEIVTRDRNNPGRVLSALAQTRFSDYTLDGFTFGLLFRRPIPSFDADGNPVFIRVSYEREIGGPNFTVSGVAGQLKIGDRLQVGAGVVQDDDPTRRMSLRALSGTYRVSRDTVLVGEYAQTNTAEFGTGGASRFELRKQGAKFQARAFSGTSSQNFNNPEAVLSRGRGETGVQLSARIGATTQLAAEAIRTRDGQSGARTQGAQIAVDHAFTPNIRASLGVRNSSGDAGFGGAVGARGNASFTSVFGRLNARLTAKSNAFTRYEQELGGGNRSLSVGADYQIAPKTRLYAIHEFFDSPLSLYALGDTQRRYGSRLGIETEYARGASLFSEYRLAGGVDGRTAQAAIGLRNQWRLRPGLGLSTSFENTRNLSGAIGGTGLNLGGDNGTAASIGLESLGSEKLKWTARLEGRDGNASRTLTATAGAAYQPTRDLTLLGRAAYAKSGASGFRNINSGIGGGIGGVGFDQKQTRLQLGLAYRPVKSDRFAALFKYELRDGDDPTGLLSRLQRRQNIVSADANYLVSRSLQARLHYAYKNSRDNTDNLQTATSAQLLSGRVSKDLSRRLSLSLLGSTLWNGQARQTAYGIEAGLGLSDNLLLSLGYNFSQLRNRDFRDETLGKGFYLRMRFKFDEDLLDGLGAFRKAPVASNAKPFVPVEQGSFGGRVIGGSEAAGLEGFTGASAPRLDGGAGGRG